jgi:AraC family transcriptional regulator, exoenzyme S synthesis regulatory protein ExsA
MVNLYESIRFDPSFNKLEIGDLLFAEYTCPIGEERLGLFAHTDYLVHVISGKKTWQTMDGDWTARAGETLFFKKGAAIIRQFFEVDFCLLLFFIPDRLIRDTVRELSPRLGPKYYGAEPLKCAARVVNDLALSAFFQSMLTYFSGREKPSEPLLQLKVRELVVGILTGSGNPQLAAYFRSLEDRDAPSVREIMETNFRFNLSLEEYAQLCHRSLSSFKRDFGRDFGESPGKWLLQQRLDYAAALLRSTSRSVTEIVFDSGFEDVSHFSRVFKERFHLTPTAYREPSLRRIEPGSQIVGPRSKARR